MNTTAQQILDCFKANYSSSPILYYSPGRINLIGEHIDYNSGYVMPAAIDKGIYFAIANNHTNNINFYAFDFNEKLTIPVSEVKKMDGWKNYVLSVVNEFQLSGKNIQGFDCVFGGDIPRGSGMSSSAAVEGGLAFALNDIFNIGLNRVELALLCQRAEHNFPNVKCGIMDMYANLLGKKDQVILLDCENITHEYFPFVTDEYAIVLLNSKVHHSLAAGEYNIRRQQCEEGLEILKQALHIQTFREIKDSSAIEPLQHAMPPAVYNCCKYVVEEIGRTQQAGKLLKQNNIAGFGKLMYATHEGLSKLYNVSCKELDFLVDQAKQNNAVAGARLMGGGFGGCTINLVQTDVVDEFIEQVTTSYQKQFNITPEAYTIKISDGTARIESA